MHRGACRYSHTVSVICIWFYQNWNFLADIYRTGRYRISRKSSFYQLISCIQTDKWMAGQNVSNICWLGLQTQLKSSVITICLESHMNLSITSLWCEVGLLTTNTSVIICSNWPLDISCDLCSFKVDAVSRLCRVICDHWILPLEFGVSSGNGMDILANMYFSMWAGDLSHLPLAMGVLSVMGLKQNTVLLIGFWMLCVPLT